jgi:hypothetical protein
MRIRASFSITAPSKAKATVTVVGAVRALVSLAKEITAPKAAATITAGFLAASAAYAAPKYEASETPRLRAEISFPVQFMDGATPIDTVAISIDKVFVDVSTVGDAIDYYTFVKVLNDSVTTSDFLSRVHTKPLDFDETDADVDPDPAFATDFAAFDLTRPDIADSVATSDFANKHTTKVRQDVATTSDGIDYLVATKVLVDTAVPTDVIDSFVLVRPDVADTATTSDADAKQVTKPDLSSNAETSDAAALHPQPVYADTAEATDAIDFLNPTKVLADGAGATDELAKDLTRPNVADTATTSDDPDFTATKVLADTATTFDVNAKVATKLLADEATTADANTKVITAVLADSVTVTDDAEVLLVPLRFFTEDSSTADNLVIAEFTTGVDSRSINGYAIDESQFN